MNFSLTRNINFIRRCNHSSHKENFIQSSGGLRKRSLKKGWFENGNWKGLWLQFLQFFMKKRKREIEMKGWELKLCNSWIYFHNINWDTKKKRMKKRFKDCVISLYGKKTRFQIKYNSANFFFRSKKAFHWEIVCESPKYRKYLSFSFFFHFFFHPTSNCQSHSISFISISLSWFLSRLLVVSKIRYKWIAIYETYTKQHVRTFNIEGKILYAKAKCRQKVDERDGFLIANKILLSAFACISMRLIIRIRKIMITIFFTSN